MDTAEDTFCYAHPRTPTRLRCTRCDRPICGRCAIPASVGQHCPECVAEARRSAPKVRTAMAANAPVVMAILIVTIGFFFAGQASPRLEFRLAMFPPAIEDGEWWRLFTPVLVHANILHIGMNMLILYIYGQNVEQTFGSVRFVLIYLVSALLGSAFSFAFGSGRPSVGASGAIFGVVGALIVYLYRRRSSALMGQYLNGLVTFVAINAVIGLIIPGIDVFAHLGGFAGGAALALGFDRETGPQASAPAGVQAAALMAVVGAGVLLVAFA
ncbi:MAG: rhomboid family intramembrane serine protease [Actinomycetota bacterium]